MKRFVALYFLFLAVLFGFFYAPSTIVSILLNDGQTSLTLYFLGLFLSPEQLQGIDIWINPHYKIFISKACNGIIPILFLFASILAYPSSILHKILWMGLGYVIFSAINVFRILLVVYVTQRGTGHADFYWSHDLVGNALLMFTGLILFIAFIKTSTKGI
jgi:exosortase/archaeosortase family protein